MAEQILIQLGEFSPAEQSLQNLREKLPQFSALPDEDWFSSLSILIQLGYIYGLPSDHRSRHTLAADSHFGVTPLLGVARLELVLRSPQHEHAEVRDLLLPLLAKSAFKSAFDSLASVAQPLSLLVIDLDRFQFLNSLLGHYEGDSLLIEIASAIRAAAEPKGRCYRWGGGAIAVLLPDCSAAQAMDLAEHLRKMISLSNFRTLSRSHETGPGLVHEPVTVSIGVSTFPEIVPTLDQFIASAEDAMHAAKRQGRNCVSLSVVPTASQSRKVNQLST